MTVPRPDQPNFEDALSALSQVPQPSLQIKYATMWVKDAAVAETSAAEAGFLARAEGQLSQALLAGAAPSPELWLAYDLVQKARTDATD